MVLLADIDWAEGLTIVGLCLVFFAVVFGVAWVAASIWFEMQDGESGEERPILDHETEGLEEGPCESSPE